MGEVYDGLRELINTIGGGNITTDLGDFSDASSLFGRLSQYGIEPRSDGSKKTSPDWFPGWFGNNSGYYGGGGGGQSYDNSSKKKGSIFHPFLVKAWESVAGLGGVTVTAEAASVTLPSGSVLGAAAAFVPKDVFIYACAAAAGITIADGTVLAIEEFLDDVKHIDWGPNSTASHVVSTLVNTPQGIKSFFEYELIQRVIDGLIDFGIYEAPAPVVPVSPDIGTLTTYDFADRFPQIPDYLMTRCQNLINKFNIDVNNKYIHVAVAHDTNLYLNVFSSNKVQIVSRDSRINGNQPFLEGEVTSVVGGNVTLKQYEATPDGQLNYIGEADAWLRPITLINGSDAAVVWDNFGTNYRTMNANNLRDLANIANMKLTDPNATTLSKGSDIPTTMPQWWGDRIQVSAPKVNRFVDGRLDPIALNNKEDWLPLNIPVGNTKTGSGAIPNSLLEALEQILEISGQSLAAIVESYVDLKDDVIPVPVPKPTSDEDVDQQLKGKTTGPDDIEDDDEIEISGHSRGSGGVDDTPPPPPPIDGFEFIGPDFHFPTDPTAANCAFLSMYNPTSSELNNFSSWLWSTDFSTTIQKLLRDPFNAIIGLHMIYATPPTSGRNSIVLGGVDSEVNCNIVSQQYASINCGTIKINEHFQNVHDYLDTQIQVYLPFIGIVDVNVAEVMGKTMEIVYKVDFLSGECLAYINLSSTQKNGSTAKYTAYTFTGNCAVAYPLSGADYTGVLGGLLMASAGIVFGGAAMVGSAGASGAAAGAGASSGASQLVGGLASAAGAQAHVQRSGSIVANAGAMGYKKPYIIITRNIPHDATNKGYYEGLPQMMTTTLSKCVGFTRVKAIQLNSIGGTIEEQEMILSKLKEGVYI